MPGLEQVHRQFGAQGLKVFGASIDLAAATDEVTGFAHNLGITFPILRDPQNRVSRTFQLIGVPGTVLIDRNGVIAHRWMGAFDPTSEAATRVIRSVLQQDSAASH
jgi:peroxiredoxin